MLTVDTEYHWKGFGNGFGSWDSYCHLRIYARLNKNIVMVSDCGIGSGTSITNSAENLATLICRDKQIDPNTLIWIEHYPSLDPKEETFDLVKFTVTPTSVRLECCEFSGAKWFFSSPKWLHLGRKKAEKLVGQDLVS